MIAAGLVYMGGFGEPDVFKNTDALVPAARDRARGFRGERLMAMAPWFANIGAANGAFCDAARQLVVREGWRIFPDANEE